MHVFFSSSAQCLPLSAQSDYSYSQRLLTAENGQNSGFGQERRAQQTVWRSAIIFTYWVRTQDCPGGRQASELLAVPVGRSPARIAPTGRISAFPFSDVFLSQVVVSLHLFGSYYLIKRPDNYIILCIHDSPQPFRRPAHAANRPENRSVASDPRYPDQPGRADLFGQVCGGHRDPDLAAEQICQDQEERQRSIGGQSVLTGAVLLLRRHQAALVSFRRVAAGPGLPGRSGDAGGTNGLFPCHQAVLPCLQYFPCRGLPLGVEGVVGLASAAAETAGGGDDAGYDGDG